MQTFAERSKWKIKNPEQRFIVIFRERSLSRHYLRAGPRIILLSRFFSYTESLYK